MPKYVTNTEGYDIMQCRVCDDVHGSVTYHYSDLGNDFPCPVCHASWLSQRPVPSSTEKEDERVRIEADRQIRTRQVYDALGEIRVALMGANRSLHFALLAGCASDFQDMFDDFKAGKD